MNTGLVWISPQFVAWSSIDWGLRVCLVSLIFFKNKPLFTVCLDAILENKRNVDELCIFILCPSQINLSPVPCQLSYELQLISHSSNAVHVVWILKGKPSLHCLVICTCHLLSPDKGNGGVWLEAASIICIVQVFKKCKFRYEQMID